jgi:hypothetical protein
LDKIKQVTNDNHLYIPSLEHLQENTQSLSKTIFIEETLVSILQQNPLPRSYFFATHKQGPASLKYTRQTSSPNRLRTCAR